MSEKFSNKILVYKSGMNSSKTPDLKSVEFLSVPNSSPPLPLVLPRLSKEKLSKSKLHGKNILKLKDSFSNLPNKKIKNMHRTVNDTGKTKLHINIMTKGSLCK